MFLNTSMSDSCNTVVGVVFDKRFSHQVAKDEILYVCDS